jgi:flavin-binding protein dodecin
LSAPVGDLDSRASAQFVPGFPRPMGDLSGDAVSDHVYRLSEIVGSSQTSVDDAIRNAIRKAAETVRNIDWFQAEEIRGQVVDGDVAYYQVTLKVGFRVD